MVTGDVLEVLLDTGLVAGGGHVGQLLQVDLREQALQAPVTSSKLFLVRMVMSFPVNSVWVTSGGDSDTAGSSTGRVVALAATRAWSATVDSCLVRRSVAMMCTK